MDPNAVLVVTSLLGAFATWVWRKARGEKVGSGRSIILEALRPEIVEAIDHKLSAIATHYKLKEAAWAALERAGFKRSRVLELAVSEAVEIGVAEFREKMRAIANEQAAKELPAQLEQLQRATRDIEGAFEAKPPEDRDVPPLGLTVEIVKD